MQGMLKREITEKLRVTVYGCLAWLLQGMRIDEEALSQVTGAELRILKQVYKHRRVQDFTAELAVALGLELGHNRDYSKTS